MSNLSVWAMGYALRQAGVPCAEEIAEMLGKVKKTSSLYLYGTPNEIGNIGLRNGESVTMYDGAVLPPLPEWDKTKYPYAYVCKNPSVDYHHAIYFTNIPVFVCYNLEDDKYTHLYQTETISYVKYRRPKDFTPDADDVWVYDYAYTESDGLFDQAFVPIWANVDVERINRWRTNDTYPYTYEYEATGEIAIAASDPIPVSGLVGYKCGDWEVPVFDIAEYPFIHVLQDQHSDDTYIVVVTDREMAYKNSGGYIQNNIRAVDDSSLTKFRKSTLKSNGVMVDSPEWEVINTTGTIDGTTSGGIGGTLIWSNYKLTSNDGLVTPEASEPIPVYK